MSSSTFATCMAVDNTVMILQFAIFALIPAKPYNTTTPVKTQTQPTTTINHVKVGPLNIEDIAPISSAIESGSRIEQS